MKQKCSRKYIMLMRIDLFLLAFVALCAAVILAVEGIRLGTFVMGGVCVLLCAAAVAAPVSSGRITYARTGGCISIERGLLVRRRLIINRSDIRYSEISGSPMERRLGICTVTFFTGGGAVRLRGIYADDGRRLNYLFGGEAAE